MENQDHMRRAIELAKKGEGWCHPNPLVGAVIVKDGRIIGEGYHERYGDLHAERNAIKNLTESAEGAEIYVTLEPCCHHGKQPPCTEAIVSSGIKKVFIGSRDPNPLVSGKGTAFLREHGIEVIEDFLREECDELNPVFFHYITTKRPYVRMKYAMTMDGKIATKTGRSRWITGEAAREEVHRMRHASMGIMAGIGTVLADDPLLNCRMEGGRSPVRIICDSRLRIPLESQIVKTAKKYRTIVACAIPELPEGEITKDKVSILTEKICALLEAGAEIINCEAENSAYDRDEYAGSPHAKLSGVDLWRLMVMLGERNIDSVLLEGGGSLNESALKAGIVNEIDAFVAPKIFGGDARSPVCGEGVTDPEEAYRFSLFSVEKIGDDILLRYRKKC
ncbi:riboflavin biosynthesis protein RibD [Lachnospiraceae bacterium JC7]|nr:riboflavin biosynthesis protein RibD [Lachnospiraceae bacterium JC7]